MKKMTKVVEMNVADKVPYLSENMFHFDFYTDGSLSHEEKMAISSKGLAALEKVLKEVVGNRANHNMSFSFE